MFRNFIKYILLPALAAIVCFLLDMKISGIAWIVSTVVGGIVFGTEMK